MDFTSAVWIEIQPPETAAPLLRELRGPTTIGGSAADGITISGLPPAALRVEPRAAGVICVPAAPGLRVGARPVAPGTRRLLRPGERTSFQAVLLRVSAPAAGEHTRAGAAALLHRAVRDPTAPPGPHVVVLTGPQAGERALLGEGLVLGRGRGAALRLADASASRRHARIEPRPEGITALDLGAKNPLKVNGVAVERRPVLLRPGDLLTIGETELAYQGPAAPAAAPPPARPPSPRRPAATPQDRSGATAAESPRPRRAGTRPLLASMLLAVFAAFLAAIASCG